MTSREFKIPAGGNRVGNRLHGGNGCGTLASGKKLARVTLKGKNVQSAPFLLCK
jgi:hypothetical protein